MRTFFILLFALSSWNVFARPADDDITYKEAQARKKQVKSVSYNLYFELEKNSDLFKGKTTITTELNHIRTSLSVDSLIDNIEKLMVNGKEIKNFPKRLGSFDIPASALKSKNTIEITYSSNYSKAAQGFKKVKDPVDGTEYVHTDFEPYYAHWLFPCFDQPDLKATYELTVKAPSDWLVIHNDLVKESKKDGVYALTTFNRTKPFSTYLFFIAAGPYQEWRDGLNGLPLYIYARRSMAQYMDEKKIFDTTKKGLQFYNDYFGTVYPFPKYGQIFVADFAPGAMENPGMVTINEQRFLYRGPVSRTTMEDRDNLILHEMAHMWFGDLVTMEWWNDLWLNESFATYAATLAQERGLKSNFASIDFLSTKAWGYWQDQLITSHPIETNVPDVRTSKGIFDGITYAKGASALKQLHFFVGEDGFRDGLKKYFKTFAWGNTQRKDFINAIAEASGKDLSLWTKKWLQTAGPNKVSLSFSCKDQKISQASITQMPSLSGVLSPHRTKLGLYKKENNRLVFQKEVAVNYDQKVNSIKELENEACPDFVLPNLEDKDYALFSLDEKSLELASVALTELPDPLSRFEVWTILLQMVRDEKLKPLTFFDMAIKALEVEKDELLIGLLFSRHSFFRLQYFQYLKVDERELLSTRLEEVLWKRIQEEKAGSSIQISYFDFLVSVLQTPENQKRFLNMIKTDKAPSGITLDHDRRWAMIISLAMNGHPEIHNLIEEELKKDPSTLGKRYAFAAKVAVPDSKNKKDNLQFMLTTKDMSYSDLKEASRVYNSVNYPEVNKASVEDYFKIATTMDWHKNDYIVDLFFENMFPSQLCTKEVETLSKTSFKKARNLTSIVIKSWKESQDELSRCIRVRK